MTRSASRKVVYAALIGNVLVALTKFVAAAVTGSSAMLSEAIHSVVDTGTEGLLLYGLRRAARRPDALHPLGYGRELYFWSFVVALLVFALGAGLSVYEGLSRVHRPAPVTDPHVNYIVFGLAILFESGSWWVAVREFRRVKGRQGYLEAVRESKDPPAFMVLLEDSAALIGLGIALAGTVAAEAFDWPALDGAASIGIGLLLAIVATVLARESKGLLIGEAARPAVLDAICAIARAERGVEHANRLLSVHVGPRQIVAALSVDFADDLTARDVEDIVARIERRVTAAHPEILTLLVKPQSVPAFRETLARQQRVPDDS
jgi:cation diffusion facilitator family transporter